MTSIRAADITGGSISAKDILRISFEGSLFKPIQKLTCRQALLKHSIGKDADEEFEKRLLDYRYKNFIRGWRRSIWRNISL